MLYVYIDRVFSGDWSNEVTISTTVAMANVILDALTDIPVYVSGGSIVEPTEEQSEAIESGIGDVTLALL